jgi:hypothetical protein
MASKMDQSPVLQPGHSLFTQISYSLWIWALKLATTAGFSIARLLRPLPGPTIVKAYPCRPNLRNRVFIPRSHRAGELLPLYLDVHGGLEGQDKGYCGLVAPNGLHSYAGGEGSIETLSKCTRLGRYEDLEFGIQLFGVQLDIHSSWLEIRC